MTSASSSSSHSRLLSVEDSLKELVERAGASSASEGRKSDVNLWVKDSRRLTKSLASPDYVELQELFGEDKIHSLYTSLPSATLAVTASFIRAVQTKRLAPLLAQSESTLSDAEQTTKRLWEETLRAMIDSVVEWCPSLEDDKNAAPQVGSALYETLCPFLVDNFSLHVGDELKKSIADLLEQTVAGCKANKLLLSDPGKGKGFMKIKTIGELFFSSTQAPYPLPAIYLDLIAHLNPRFKEIEQRTKHAEVAFKPFDQVDLAGKPAPALAERLRKLLVETPNSEWYSTRAKLLSSIAQSDVNRLQIFPLLSVHQSSTGDLDLLDNADDQESIEKGIKFLYLDSGSVIYSWHDEEGEEENMTVAFQEIIKTTFKVEGAAGSDQTTLMTCETKNRGVFKFKLGCSRSAIQKVCARRPFATPIDSPVAYDRRRSSVPAGPPLMLPESPIAGGDGSEEAVEVVEEEQDAGEVRFSQLEEVEKTAIQQPPTPVNPPSISAQAKIPPPSPKKPLSSAASSSSFVKKKIPPPHLNLDPMNRQPNPSSSSSNHHPIEKPKSNKSSKPSSSSRSQAPAGPPAPPKKPLLSNTTTSSKLSKLSPPKGPSLDASLFGKGNGSDSELSEVSTIGPSQSQSQSQVRAPTSKRKRVGLLEASQEEEEDEESGRGSGKGKKKLKMEMETKKRKDRHRDSDESNDEEDDLDEDNDEEEEEEEGGGTSLAAPPTKQSVPKKTYGSSARKKSLPPPSHTKPNSNSKPKPNPPPKKATLVGSLKSESNVVASDLATSPFPSSSSSPPRPTHQHQHQHRHAGGMEMDEYDDLPSVPEGGKLNPITAARREPAPSKTPLKAKGIKGKGKGGMRGGGGGGKKMVGAGGKKEKEKKSKETISSDEEEEEEEGTKGGRTSRTLRNKLKSTLVVGREESGVGVGVEGGRRSARKRGDRASGKGVECVGREEEEGDEDMVSGEEEKVGGGGKGKGKEKGKRKKELAPATYQHVNHVEEENEEEEEEEEIYSFPVDDNNENFANDNPSPSSSARNDFLLSPSHSHSQPFAYEESQAVLGGATFKTQNSQASDEMDLVGNDTNTSGRPGDHGDVEMEMDEGEEVVPMPSPLQEDEEMHVVLSGGVGNSMPLGKKRMGSKGLGEERIKRRTFPTTGRVDAVVEEEIVEMEEDGDKTIVQYKKRSVASSSASKGDESFASVATAGTSTKSSKIPSPIKPSKNNVSDPWKNPDSLENQLQASLTAEGMSGTIVIEQSRSIKALPSNASSNRSRAPSPPTALPSRSSSRQAETSRPRPNQIDASKKKEVVAPPPPPPAKKTAVDSNSEEIEEDSIDENASEEIEEDEEEVVRSAYWPIKETKQQTPRASTMKTSTSASNDGPQTHPTPKITPRNVRINSKPDYMGEGPQPTAAESSSTKTKPTSLAAPEPSKTTAVPRQSSSASSSQRKEAQHTVVERELRKKRVDVEQDHRPQDPQTSSRSQTGPSSTKKPASTTQGPPPLARASHIVHLPQPPAAAVVESAPKPVVPRSPTPQAQLPSVEDQKQQKQQQSGRGRSKSPSRQTGRAVDRDRSSAQPSVPEKPITELADLVEGLEDREGEEGHSSRFKQTLDIIVTELDKRYTNRVKKTQSKAKETQTRLTSNTQKLALHLVHRTSVIVDASKRRTGMLNQLNANVATTTREARVKSEDVVKEVERLVAREERRNEQWPTSFFA